MFLIMKVDKVISKSSIDESDADERFIKDFSKTHNLEVFTTLLQ